MVQPKGSALAILIVDDEANIRKTLSVCLEMEGHRVTADGGGQSRGRPGRSFPPLLRRRLR